MKIAGTVLPPALADAVRECRPHFLAAAIFSFFLNLLFLAPAIYMLQVYDRVVATGGKTTLLFITLALAIALITLSALDAIRLRLLVRASLRLDALLAPQILKRVLGTNPRGSVQAMRDFDMVRQMIGTPVVAAVFDAPWAPLFVFVAFLLHFWIGVLAVFSIAVLLCLAWWNQRVTRKSNEAANEAMAAAQMSAQTLSLNSQTVRALGMSGRLIDRQLGARRLGLDRFADAQFSGTRIAAMSRFFRLFVQSAALGLGALLAIEGYISAGAIIAASILLSRALQPVEALIGGWPSLNAAAAALRRLADTLEDTGPQRIYTRLPRPSGRVQVEQVGVRGADGRPVLLNVSFDVAPGEMLGIIGPSGSGKTTLARVLGGALPADAGTVRLDGAQLADWDPDELGRLIGYVPQEPSLFEGTIKENIARFDPAGPDADEAAVEAARRAGAHDMILKLPNGYDSRLGPLGAGLSSGQAQRIALARALYGDPVVLVLDEPNAFLDAEGEAALARAVNEALQRQCSVVMIAHRKAVLEPAARLLVLEGGRPRMIGPAAEVAARLAAPPAGRTA